MALVPVRANAILPQRGALFGLLPSSGPQAQRGVFAVGRDPRPSFKRASARNPFALAPRGRSPNRHSSAAGFALVGVIALTPLMVALVACTVGFFLIVKKKLWAQSICVKAAVLLQHDLQKDLEDLLRLNPQARRLNQRRRKAEQAFRAAVKSGNALLVKVAGAAVVSVTAEQMALRAKQETLLLRAGRRRERARSELARESSESVRGQRFFPRALAVVAEPPSSLTPEYKPAPAFAQAQQHRFQFAVELAPEFLRRSFIQTTACSASLQQREGKWQPKIITANP